MSEEATRTYADADGIIVPQADRAQRRAFIRINCAVPVIIDGGRVGWFDAETLDLSLLNSGTAPLLKDHYRSTDTTAGVIERAWIEGTHIFAVARFGRTPVCRDAWDMVADGIMQHVSLGLTSNEAPHPDGSGATLWRHARPYEISLTPTPRNWLARIAPGPIPAEILERAAATAAATACGNPATWRAWGHDLAAAAAAQAGNGADAMRAAIIGAVEVELSRLSSVARAAFLSPFTTTTHE